MAKRQQTSEGIRNDLEKPEGMLPERDGQLKQSEQPEPQQGAGRGKSKAKGRSRINRLEAAYRSFDPSVGVIVIAATNRPEVLDRALLRPGRFDRRVAVQSPDTAGRRKILDVHTRSVPLAPDVDLDRLAATTPGMVGADLANIVNEAALTAARRGHDVVTMADLHDSLEKLVLGSERRILMSGEERRRTAYHEAGHALVGMLTPGADPVRKVSIIPRGIALGITFSAPDADRFSYDRPYLLGKIKVALGGRVAEELIYGEVTTGAQNDIKQVTELARNMVGLWGMSHVIGPVTVIPEEGQMRFPADRGPVRLLGVQDLRQIHRRGALPAGRAARRERAQGRQPRARGGRSRRRSAAERQCLARPPRRRHRPWRGRARLGGDGPRPGPGERAHVINKPVMTLSKWLS